ncbi:MAG: hypothetical protein NTX79_07945 [Candidatus Micrarchaeota archaeon]|nr:hypothetical protein [Candidatus Micrarchaeota archaeon]
MKQLSLKEAKALLPAPAAMKTASPAFLAWFRQLGKTASAFQIVEKFAESKEQSVYHPGKATNESQRLLALGDWAAGVAMGKARRQARMELILPKLGIAYCTYKLLIEKPPVDLGAAQLREIKRQKEAAESMFFIVLSNGHIKQKHTVSVDDFVRRGPFDLF